MTGDELEQLLQRAQCEDLDAIREVARFFIEMQSEEASKASIQWLRRAAEKGCKWA